MANLEVSDQRENSAPTSDPPPKKLMRPNSRSVKTLDAMETLSEGLPAHPYGASTMCNIKHIMLIPEAAEMSHHRQISNVASQFAGQATPHLPPSPFYTGQMANTASSPTTSAFSSCAVTSPSFNPTYMNSMASFNVAATGARGFQVPFAYQNVTGRVFNSLADARAYSAAPKWTPACSMWDFPNTDEEKQPYVDTLRAHMLIFEDFDDNQKMTNDGGRYLNPVLDGTIPVACFEAAAGKIVVGPRSFRISSSVPGADYFQDAAVELHFFGKQLTGTADPTIKDGKILYSQRNMTFQEQIAALADLFMVCEVCCTLLRCLRLTNGAA